MRFPLHLDVEIIARSCLFVETLISGNSQRVDPCRDIDGVVTVDSIGLENRPTQAAIVEHSLVTVRRIGVIIGMVDGECGGVQYACGYQREEARQR